MKENNDIDKLLRASLDKHKPVPAPEGKRKFLEEAATILPGNRRPGSLWKPVIIGIILVAVTGSLVWVYNSKSPMEILSNELIEGVDQNISSNQKTESLITEQSYSEEENETEITREKGTSSKKNNLSTTLAADESKSKLMASAPEANSLPDATQDPIPNNYPVTNTQHPAPDTQYPIPNNTPKDSTQYPNPVNNSQDSLAKTDISQPDTTVVFNQPEPLPEKGGIPMYNLFYRPEYGFRMENNSKMIHSIGAEFQFRPFHPKYVIRAGAGISLSPGSYDYGIDYHEYLGSYLQLDSITFTLAEDNFHLLPTYHQTERESYDQEVQTQYMSTDKRFVYLYIPVSLGYDFIRHDRFTFGLRAGPSVSLLLNKKVSEPQYNLGDNQLVRVDRITPEREVMNWLVSGGLNLTFIGKNNYFIEAEPVFNYYFNRVKGEDGKDKNPYSIGLRIATGIIPDKTRKEK